MPDETKATADTLIWSGEHRAYWRPEACGYTTDPMRAGVWNYIEAKRMTQHCGPDKKIELLLRHTVPAIIQAMNRHEQAAIALWRRFAPGSQLEWSDEPHKAEYLAAVDAVKEALHV